MSHHLTFRQKLIRVGCSAAICGLSVSFLLGESVDSHAKMLQEWASDPALLPQGYLPLRPVLAALDKVESPQWKENLVAVNDLPAVYSAANPETPIATAIAKPILYEEPALRAVSAAPRKISQARVIPAPAAPLAAAKVIADAPLPAAEVEKLLYSIHEATAKLSGEPGAALAASSRVSQSNDAKGKTEPAPPAPNTTKSQPELLASRVPVAFKERVADPRVKRATPVSSWAIQGKVWGATAQNAGTGHFEVGLFAKIDPDGKPVGYPLPQQILPAGQTSFRLEVPGTIDQGYLFAEYVSAKTGHRTLIAPPINPWVRGPLRSADLYFHAEDSIASVTAAPVSLKEATRDQWHVQGSVGTLFTPTPIPQSDVIVRVRGRKEAARTDAKGNFALDLPKMKGFLYLEVLKAGYHPTIVSIPAGDERPVKIEIASRHAIEQISQRLGANQGAAQGIFLGQATAADGGGLRGVTAQLSLKADGPFYFDDEGSPTRDAKATSTNGRFLFLNVEDGTGYLETALNGESIAPIQVSSVDGGELIQKRLVPVSGSLRGRIFNPVAANGKMQPVSGARVRVDGASEWVTSDAYGAFSLGPMKWIRGERVSLEVSAEKFNNHRYLVSDAAAAEPLNLFAFPAAYVAHLARSMDVDVDPYAGIVIGKVSGPSLRIDALAEQATVNNAKDFYFDAKGRLRGSHEMTDPRFGTYIIFNVPKGRALLQGNDSAGILRYSDSVFASPSSINIEMD